MTKQDYLCIKLIYYIHKTGTVTDAAKQMCISRSVAHRYLGIARYKFNDKIFIFKRKGKDYIAEMTDFTKQYIKEIEESINVNSALLTKMKFRIGKTDAKLH